MLCIQVAYNLIHSDLLNGLLDVYNYFRIRTHVLRDYLDPCKVHLNSVLGTKFKPTGISKSFLQASHAKPKEDFHN